MNNILYMFSLFRIEIIVLLVFDVIFYIMIGDWKIRKCKLCLMRIFFIFVFFLLIFFVFFIFI